MKNPAKPRTERTERALTPKQEMACRAFVELGDKAAAYRRAYNCARMKPESIRRKAVDLFASVNVRAMVEQLQAAAAKRNEVTVDRVIQEYAKLAFTDLPGIVEFGRGRMSLTDFVNLTAAQRACIKKFKCRTITTMVEGEATPVEMVEVELHDKQHALDMLGKHLGMFIDRVEHSGSVVFQGDFGDTGDDGD